MSPGEQHDTVIKLSIICPIDTVSYRYVDRYLHVYSIHGE